MRISDWSSDVCSADLLGLNVGARYTENRKTVDNFNDAATLGTFVLSPALRPAFTAVFGAPYAFQNLKTIGHLFHPQAIITYKPDDNITLFAKAVRGAKAGGVDYQFGAGATNPRGAIFKPEKALSYEAGVKALLLDRKLSVDLTAFRTDFTDLQVSISDGRVSFIITNAGKARSQGLELETTYRPIPPLTLNFAVSYLDSKYLNFRSEEHTSELQSLMRHSYAV